MPPLQPSTTSVALSATVRRRLNPVADGPTTYAGVEVTVLKTKSVGGVPRRAIHFHRFRSRGLKAQHDATGALLDIMLPEEIEGPLAVGYGSHFGLGLFGAVAGESDLGTVNPLDTTTHATP